MIKYDLEDEIRACPVIMAKIQADDKHYAQNLYAAWCNMQWCKRDPKNVWPILNEEYWSASWRAAGRIVAELRGKGEDYMDYYCSGIREVSYDEATNKWWDEAGYASEGEITTSILEDLDKLGWFPVPYTDDYL